MCLHVLQYSLFFLSNVLIFSTFQHRGLAHLLLDLFLGIFGLGAIGNAIL